MMIGLVGLITYNNKTTYSFNSQKSNKQCLLSGGNSAPNWANCAFGTNVFQINNGAITPINQTLDFLIGGTSTASAKFGITNVNSGTTTATISAAGGALFLDASGNIGTTNNQTLTLGGGGTTGNIVLNNFATGIIHSTNGVLSSSAVNLAGSDVSGTLPVNHG